MTDRQVILSNLEALVGADLSKAFKAVRADKTPSGLVARFKKKEDIGRMTKSILKHKIQTLTGKSIKILEEEMGYKPKDPNEPSMDVDTMKSLASSLVLLACDELRDYPDTTPAPAVAPTPTGSKRPASTSAEPGASARKSSRRSIAVTDSSTVLANGSKANGTSLTNGSSAKKMSRRSVAALPSAETTGTPGRRSRVSRTDFNQTAASSSVSQVSMSVTNCLGPEKDMADHLASVEEEAEENGENDQSLANPTPLMKEMMKKRRSVAPKTVASKSPVKAKKAAAASISPVKSVRTGKVAIKEKAKSVTALDETDAQPAGVVRPASPGPRQDFPGTGNSKVFLVAGDPMADLKMSKMISTLPLSANFSGCQLTVVHTPAEWTPTEIWQVTKHIKLLNKEAGLDSFVILVGTGLSNVHMNLEALARHTKHTQFITFHREDANKEVETGKLRETTSFFIAAYFFPGCEQEDSTLPTKMVRDGYTTCFRTESTHHLEGTIVDCFSEAGEWILDLYCGSRQLSIAAAEKGRSALAFNSEATDLEQVGDYLRTLSLQQDKTYREKDGVVLTIAK